LKNGGIAADLCRLYKNEREEMAMAALESVNLADRHIINRTSSPVDSANVWLLPVLW